MLDSQSTQEANPALPSPICDSIHSDINHSTPQKMITPNKGNDLLTLFSHKLPPLNTDTPQFSPNKKDNVGTD